MPPRRGEYDNPLSQTPTGAIPRRDKPLPPTPIENQNPGHDYVPLERMSIRSIDIVNK